MEKNNLDDSLSALSTHFNSICDFFGRLWVKIYDFSAITEIGIIASIILFSLFFKKVMQQKYQIYIKKQEKPSLYHQVLYFVLSFSAPCISFVLLSCAMSLTAGFTSEIEFYELAIRLTVVWFFLTLILHVIPDFFLKVVLCVTVIPFLVLSTFGLASPVIDYLESLGFSVLGIHLSVYILLKLLCFATCLLWIANVISRITINFISNHSSINPEMRDLLENIFHVVLYSTVVLITLNLVGINLTSLALVGGAVGIGIGFGLQKIAANFISGLIILFEQNIKVGHLVEVPGSGNPGWIRHLGARAVHIDTGDGRELLIPNEELLTKTVVDWTARDKRTRTNLKIKVAFKSNLEKAKEIMLYAVKSHPNCSKLHQPSCFLEKFTDNGAEFLLQFWVDDLTVGKMEMQNDVLLYIWKKFAEEGIEHPVPIQESVS